MITHGLMGAKYVVIIYIGSKIKGINCIMHLISQGIQLFSP